MSGRRILRIWYDNCREYGPQFAQDVVASASFIVVPVCTTFCPFRSHLSNLIFKRHISAPSLTWWMWTVFRTCVNSSRRVKNSISPWSLWREPLLGSLVPFINPISSELLFSDIWDFFTFLFFLLQQHKIELKQLKNPAKQLCTRPHVRRTDSGKNFLSGS